MAYNYSFGGSVNNSNARTGPWSGLSWVSTFNITGFPAGNPDINGTRVVRLYDIYAAQAFGAGGIRARLYIDGNVRYNDYTLYNPSGTFNFDIEYSSGQLGFGRNTQYGETVDSRGGSWAGMLVGGFNYATSPTPSGIHTISPTSTSITIYWNGPASDGGAGINNAFIQWSQDINFGSGVSSAYSNNGGTRQWTVSGLTPGVVYYFRVSMSNEVAWSPVSGVAGARTLPAAPSTPTVTSSTSGTSATLSYTQPLSTTGFEVDRSTSAAFTTVTTLATSSNTPTITGLTPGTVYYYRVRAKNEWGWGPYSSTASAGQAATASPPTITSVTPADDGEGATIVISTASVNPNGSAVTGYQLQYASDSNFTANLTTISVTNGSNVVTNLLPATTYWYRVRSINGVGNGIWSIAVSSAQPDPALGWMRNADNTAWVDMEGRIRNADNTAWVEMDGRIRNADNTAWAELGS